MSLIFYDLDTTTSFSQCDIKKLYVVLKNVRWQYTNSVTTLLRLIIIFFICLIEHSIFSQPTNNASF